MRVVAGEAAGRRLSAPRGKDLRPTSDRVRGAIGNALVSLDALEGARVVDLFAGTGALGIEALSRGAASATFVERDRSALACVRANLDATGLAAQATVVPMDAERFVGGGHGPFDVAFADPPYAYDRWPVLLARLRARLLVAESDRTVDLGERWRVVREKRYGGTVVVIAQADEDPGEHP